MEAKMIKDCIVLQNEEHKLIDGIIRSGVEQGMQVTCILYTLHFFYALNILKSWFAINKLYMARSNKTFYIYIEKLSMPSL